MGASSGTVIRNQGPATAQNQKRVDTAKAAREAEAEKKRKEAERAAAEAAAKKKAEQEAAARAEQERQARIQRESNPLYGLTPEQAAEYGRNAAIEKRYGSEFSWLDPSFQMDPALLGTSATANAQADPRAIAAQYAGLDKSAQFMNQDLQFMSPDLQRAVYDRAMGLTTNTGPGALTFDDGSRQREQYGNLGEIIRGGGASAIEMADRARARADSESWLRGQREADMADYAERGLTGSGMELQALAMDRQAAAQRNSMADLDMAKALEERRLSAIDKASGLATDMRGQTIDEQALLDRARTTGLNYASNIANTMRDQARQESVASREAKQKGLDSFNDLASDVRKQSFDEETTRTGAADDWAKLNVDIINGAKDSNVEFLRDLYDRTQQRKQDRWKEILKTKTGAAQDLMDFDQKDNLFGSESATGLAKHDADTWNAAMDAYRRALGSASDPTQVLNAQKTTNGYIGEAGAVGGAVIDEIVKSYTGGGAIDAVSKAAGGAAGGGGVASKTSALTQQPSTQPQSAGIVAANFDPDEMKKKMGYA